MSRIANIIRGLFGRKPVRQQKDSMAPRGDGEKNVQPMPENVIQKIPVEAKMMKEVSDMDFNYNELPMNLGLAFASNRLAMDRFAGMSDDEKREFVERSRGILSQNEMDELVGSLAKDDEEPDLSLERVRDVFDGPEIL